MLLSVARSALVLLPSPKMPKERLFFTGSANIIGDPRPSGLDMRVYGCVSLHDGMSLHNGRGRGCYATFATLTAKLGCDAANLSRSLKRLVDWGYLIEERQDDDRRRKTYRVIFENPECWQKRQRSDDRKLANLPTNEPEPLSISPTNDLEIVGNAEQLSDEKQSETNEHYISLKELDPPKEKLNSDESARLAARETLQVDYHFGDRENLARLDRALKSKTPVDRSSWFVFIMHLKGEAASDPTVRDLFERLRAGMTWRETTAATARYCKELRREAPGANTAQFSGHASF